MMDKIILGDCLEEMKKIKENSIDACITDPPYQLSSTRVYGVGKKIEDIKGTGQLRKNIEKNTAYGSIVKGFMGKTWDVLPSVEVWKECLRILKPGAFLLAFGGTRTYHRLTCGIEDAGFEIRDTIMWIFASGFPKSLNIGKAVDKIQGNKRKDLGEYEHPQRRNRSYQCNGSPFNLDGKDRRIEGKQRLTKGNSKWEGYGTALKPAFEPIVVARKPLSEKNVALNVMKWGTGGINIDECRIGTEIIPAQKRGNAVNVSFQSGGFTQKHQGRFPANIIFDEESAKELDRQSGIGKSVIRKSKDIDKRQSTWSLGRKGITPRGHQDIGGASRFFYIAKASRKERNMGLENMPDKPPGFAMRDDKYTREHMGNTPANKREPVKSSHPCVKPVKLLEYLVKLVCPKGGIAIDPFLGSGSTAMACKKLGRHYIGIEKEKEYYDISVARVEAVKYQGELEL